MSQQDDLEKYKKEIATALIVVVCIVIAFSIVTVFVIKNTLSLVLESRMGF